MRSVEIARDGRANFVGWLLICLLLTLAMGWLRLVVLADRLVLLTYGLPLLVCLLNRDLRLLYGMSVAFTAMAFYKGLWLIPDPSSPGFTYGNVAMQLANIWIVAGVVHALVNALGRIEARNVELGRLNDELAASNDELNATNEELSAREEEISRQNEELQSQAAELEQQTEESQQQAEESEQQSVELQAANAELARREQALQTLLDSARWLRTDLDEQVVLNALCQAAVKMMGEDVAGAAVIQYVDGTVGLRGQWGVGLGSGVVDGPFADSFAAIMLERGRTACIEDISARPDLRLPIPAAGGPFRSVLATPVWCEGEPVAAFEVYGSAPRQWTEGQFRLIEWFGAQAALAMRAIRAQRELERKRREAEEASIRKTQFLAAVSHDVRTPANAISLLAHLIERTAALPERVRDVPKMAQDLRANARALTELVSDVLDLARFDTGQVEPHRTDFSLNALIAAEVTQSAAVADAKGVRLTATLPEPEVWLRTDRLKLSRVLGNLVGNAIKFTAKGEVAIRCQRRGDGGIEVSVADTGVGISEQHLPRIFDEFFQLNNPERDRTKGTGLGLAICQRLADALGCRLRVSSVAGKGSTFTIEIPAAALIREPPAGTAAPAPAWPASGDGHDGAARHLAGVRLLLVEDHDVTRDTVARLLASAGAIVVAAANGGEALRLLEQGGDFDVLLLDLMLPDMDGTEVLARLNGRRPERLRCVLAVSGDVRDARVEEVRRLGADDLLPKPVSLDRLLTVVRACGLSGNAPRGADGGGAVARQPRG